MNLSARQVRDIRPAQRVRDAKAQKEWDTQWRTERRAAARQLRSRSWSTCQTCGQAVLA